jgi:hypothetical protein
MTVSGAVVAPAAPGALGQAPAAADVLSYLHDLGSWRDARRQELDALDQAALASPERDALSGDVVLSMALWQAVADRYAALLRLWDSGRVGRTELDQISSLIWGRLDAAPQSMNISLPEACRLSDALAGSLRVRLSLEPGAGDVAALVRRFGEQLDRLDRRLDDFTERARRGADVGGLVEALTNDLARAERDLIVAAATRTRVRQSAERARALVARLTARGAQVRALRQECLARVTPIPRLAVPDVTALGPVPTDSGALDVYVERLEAVQRALGLAHSAYQACLQEPDELEGLVEGYHAKAAATGVANSDLREIYGRAREVLDSPPVDVRRLRALVSAYQAYLGSADKPSRPGGVR